MADNAPNSVQRPPYPNVVVGLNKRVECHIATISYTSGTPAVIQSKSSAGITVADTGTGIITVGFPAGGTGAIGWTVASLQGAATPASSHFSLDSDLDDYAAGTIVLHTYATDTDDTAEDVDFVDLTLMIFVVKA